MITRVVLENFRSHANSSFEFSAGTNVVVGVMGAGKSSVMDGICLGLFGTFPALNSKRLSLAEVIRKYPNPADKCKVTVDFTLVGKNYQVERLIQNEKSNQAYLRENGRAIAGPQSREVTQRVESLLGLDFELFSRAVYAEQNHADYFLRLSPGQRKEKLDELLGLSRYETVRSSAQQLQTRFKRLEEGKRQTLESLMLRFKPEELTLLQEKVALSEKNAADLEVSFQLAQEKENNEKKKLTELQSLQQSFKVLRDQLVTTKARLSDTVIELEKIKSTLPSIWPTLNQVIEQEKRLADEAKLFREVSQKRQSLNGQLATIQINQEKAKKELTLSPSESESHLTNLIQKQEDHFKALSLQIETIVQQAKAVISKQANTEAQFNLVIKQKNQLLSLAAKDCPLCLQPLDPKHREEVLQSLQQQIDPLQEKVVAIKSELSQVDQQHLAIKNELNSTQSEINRLRTALTVAQKKKFWEDQLRDFNQSESVLRQELENLPSVQESDLLRIESEINQCVLFKQGFTLQEKLSQLSIQQKNLEEQTTQLGFSEEVLQSSLNRFESAWKNRQELESKLREEKNNLIVFNQSLSQLVSIAKEIEFLQKTCTQLKGLQNSLGVFGQSLSQTQANLRTELVSIVNDSLSQLWPRIYPYKDLTSCHIDVLPDGGYEIEAIRADGTKTRVEGLLSGGERMSAALAIRMSFALVLTQNLSWLVLDEPTHNLDARGVKELTQTLRETLPTLVDQVFIITHDPLLEEAATGSLYEIERDKDQNQVSKPILKELSFRTD